jgi:hypothetical protein
MNLATLRMSGTDTSMDAIVDALKLNVVNRVQVGDPKRRGGVHDSAGLTADLVDADTPAAMLQAVRAFLNACEALGSTPFRDGISAEISIGVGVGDSVQFVVSIDFSPAEIRQFASIGLSLNVTAYPVSDEVDGGAEVA